MFSKIKARTIRLYNFLFAHKKQLALFVFLLVLGLGAYAIFGSHVVLADADKGAGAAPTGGFEPGMFTSAITSMLLAGAALLIKLSIFCLSFIIEIAGYNGYLNSTAVQVGWVMVRDIANMFFVVVLLLVAFGTILGLEQYEWKKMLVKFFFAAILVNFSRVICGLIIDIGQVVMITFVNGIAATAGGNLINAFNLTDILSLSKNSNAQAITNNKEIFAAAVGAIAFAALTFGTMLIFVFILLARMLVLWILIVLSPFAFVLSVIPQTEKYASQWWSEFGNHVIVGPVAVFFLWLSFAVVGSGQINNEISSKDNNSAPQSNMPGADIDGKPASAGITAAMSFDKIANFAIAIGILMVGAKTTQSLGTVGGSAMSKATDFAKKVATIGSGVAVGMWAYNKGKDLGSKGVSAVGKAAYNISPVSDWVERTQNFAKRQVESWKVYRSEGPSFKMEPEKNEDGTIKLDDKGQPRMKFINKKDEHGNDIEGEYEFDEDKRSWFQRSRYNARQKLISSRKALKKTEDTTKIREELIDKRITAIPKGWFLRDMPDGFDRVEQGMLAAEKERSAAKTKEFQEYGRKAVLSNARFKDGEFQLEQKKDRDGNVIIGADGKPVMQPKKGTIAQQIVEHNEKAERNQERTKALLSGVLEKYRQGDKGKGVLAAKVEAKFKAEVSEKAAHLAEGAAQLRFLRGQEGIAQLAKKVKIAAEEKEEHALVEETETKAQETFEGSHEGEHIRKELLRSEQAKAAAENAIKMMKGHDLAEAFQEAADEMARIIKEGKVGLTERLNEAAERDDYIKSLRSSTLLKEDERAEHLSQTRAEERAKAGWYEIPKLGKASPSTAMDQMIEETGKRLKGMEAQDGGALAGMQIAHILRLKRTGAEISDEQQAALFSSVAHITKEAWTDDTIAEISALFKDLRSGKITDAEEQADVRAMEQIFVDELGLIKRGADGSYSSVSNQENAAALQNLVVTGGNVSMVRANRIIDAELTRRKEAGDSASNYEDVAKALGASGAIGMSFDEFKTNLEKSQNLIQEGAATFKRAALDVGHTQMGGHQVYDRDMGMYRLNTLQGAMGWMVTELGKRKGIESAQIHSFGTINNETGKLEEVSVGLMRALTATVTTARQAGFVSRTTDKLSGYGIGEDKVLHTEGDMSYGVIGGGKDYSGTADSRTSFIKNVLLKEIEANSEAAKIAWGKKMAVNNDLVDRGRVNFALQLGDGSFINGGNYSEFLTKLRESLVTLGLDAREIEKQRRIIDNAIAISLSKERGGGRGGPGGGGDGED